MLLDDELHRRVLQMIHSADKIKKTLEKIPCVTMDVFRKTLKINLLKKQYEKKQLVYINIVIRFHELTIRKYMFRTKELVREMGN